MKIHDLSAEDALQEDQLEHYIKGMRFFYSELVNLNVNLFIMDKIADFRFDLFTGIEERTFFRMVFQNFFHASILTITRVAADQGGDLFTLTRFKNSVRQAVKPKFKDLIDERLRSVRFDKGTQRLLEKAHELRTQRIAHALEEIALGNQKSTRVFYHELKQLRDQLNDLLDALSFNVEHMMLPVHYSKDVIHPKGVDSRPDIEKILDIIAFTSVILNLPEKHPRQWQYELKRLNQDDISLINAYRKKFNMPPVNN
jgi:hypothetical protein